MISKKSGFTLVEIMMTLIIIAFILGMSVFTMFAYLPKQRLLDSLETMEQVLSRAQFEATSRSTWSCIKYNSTANSLSVYMDVDGNHTAANGCGNSGDMKITEQQLRQNVSFATCTGAGSDSSFAFAARPIFFDTAGVPKYCVTSCAPTTFQIVVSSSELKPGNKAREVEAVSSGLIKIVDRGEKGYLDTIFAKTPLVTGTGECE